jgi:26S proteasome regulatory subunit N1
VLPQGLVSLNPFHSDRSLCCGPALAGIVVVLLAALEPRATLHDKWHVLLFALAPAIAPRSLSFVDEAGAPLVVEVRVGTAVDTVAQAGRPKSITGFQTLSSPVLLGVKDRAELVDDTFIAAAAVLEGVVVLRPNPAAKAKKESKEREAKEKRLRVAAGGGARSDLSWQ